MRNTSPENLTTVSLSMKALKNIEKLAFPAGAIMTCASCGRTAEKTSKQMEAYLQKWPRCCGLPANVKPK